MAAFVETKHDICIPSYGYDQVVILLQISHTYLYYLFDIDLYAIVSDLSKFEACLDPSSALALQLNLSLTFPFARITAIFSPVNYKPNVLRCTIIFQKQVSSS